MRKLLIVLALVVAVLYFGEVVVRLGGWPSSPVEQKALEDAVKAFNEQYKGQIKLVYEPIPGDYKVKLTAMLSAGNAPDIFYLDVNWAEEFFSKGIIEPLDFFVKVYKLNLEDFYPNLINAFKYFANFSFHDLRYLINVLGLMNNLKFSTAQPLEVCLKC